jgi:hypothetical protein
MGREVRRVVTADDESRWVAVIPDGVDFDIECGFCGHRQRNVATSADEAWRVADEHEAACEWLEEGAAS